MRHWAAAAARSSVCDSYLLLVLILLSLITSFLSLVHVSTTFMIFIASAYSCYWLCMITLTHFCSLCAWLLQIHVLLPKLQTAFNTPKMLFPVLLLQLPGPPILHIFTDLCTQSRYENALNTKLSLPYISSCNLLHDVTYAISSQYNLSIHSVICIGRGFRTEVHSSLKITNRSYQDVDLTCWTCILLLFVFHVNLVRSSVQRWVLSTAVLYECMKNHYPALLELWSSTGCWHFSWRFSFTFSNHPFLKVFPSMAIYVLPWLISWNLTIRYLAATGGGSFGDCGRLK